MPPLSSALLIARDLGLPAAAAMVVIVLASLVSKGTLHRTDRIGAAAVAVGFALGFHPVYGGGFDAENAVSVLPLVAVVCALLAPRIATRFAPSAALGVFPRAALLFAGVASAVALFAAGETGLTEIALVTVGAALGLVIGPLIPTAAGVPAGEQPSGAMAPDPRVGAWAVVAILLVAIWGFGLAGVVGGG